MRQPPDKSNPSNLHRSETLEFHQSAVARAIQFMRRDPGATLDWDELAEIACMSRYHFLRVFEGLTHVSPHRFLIALRVEKAKQLLLETAMDVHYVCLKVGYTSVSTFNRVFKELVGLTPGKFRSLAEKLPEQRFQLMLAKYLDRQNDYNPGNALRVNLEVPEPFAGTVFAGFFNSQSQPLAPLAGALVRHSKPMHFRLAEANEADYLLAIGFLNTMKVNQYFLPDRHSLIAVSTATPVSSGRPLSARTMTLQLRNPSIFDPPVLVCLPHLLVNSGEAKDYKEG